jgi:hypothetical protein
MPKLRVAVVDLIAKGPERGLFSRIMSANLASIMPQVVAAWCEQQGHRVTFVSFTGRENLLDELPTDVDLAFIGAFTESAQLAYAVSSLLRSRGAITALGGPHARCYPEDARQYFDYVLGFTDQSVIRDVLADCSAHRPLGLQLSAAGQPAELPGVEERWKFIEPTLQKAPFLKVVPMIGSLGCPYTCSFCIDAAIPYKPLDFGVLKRDLRFLLGKHARPVVGWHDPNFGVRFNDCMDAIEDAVPANRIDFIAESSLSLLSEAHVTRLKAAGFKAILPGIESWFSLGGKSKTGSAVGMEKVRHVSDQVNMILRHIPYMQTNFVLGLDCDEGPEPFELTKRFVDLTPGAFPGYSLLTAFGQAAPLNLEYQRDGRVLPHPFHLLNNHHGMNVTPKNYTWTEFYDRVIDLTSYTYSWRAIGRRYRANRGAVPSLMNVVRAISSEGFGRIRYHKEVRRRLDTDPQLRRYFHSETDEVPRFYVERVRRNLGPFYRYLPEGALRHDQNAYLKSAGASGEPGAQSQAAGGARTSLPGAGSAEPGPLAPQPLAPGLCEAG